MNLFEILEIHGGNSKFFGKAFEILEILETLTNKWKSFRKTLNILKYRNPVGELDILEKIIEILKILETPRMVCLKLNR